MSNSDDRPVSVYDPRLEAELRFVPTVVVALLPTYHQVKVRDEDGLVYSLTRRTAGIDLQSLSEGQRVNCIVSDALCRVVRASIL